jgi:hypothetical protein
MASTVEALWAILARLEAGIGVVQLKHTGKPKDLGEYPRPEWVGKSSGGEVVVTSVAEAIRIMRGGDGQ